MKRCQYKKTILIKTKTTKTMIYSRCYVVLIIMNNELYKMMINNAKQHLKEQDPNKPKEDDFNAFKISEVLALCLCKTKEDVIMDIVNAT